MAEKKRLQCVVKDQVWRRGRANLTAVSLLLLIEIEGFRRSCQ